MKVKKLLPFAALLAGNSCEPGPPPQQAAAATPVAVTLAPAQPTETPYYDTISLARIWVNGEPLTTSRRELRRTYGLADTAFVEYHDDIASCLPSIDSLAAFEVYNRTLYLRDGPRLVFMQTWPPDSVFSVQVGAHRIDNRTALADLRRWFPRSSKEFGNRGHTHGEEALFLLEEPGSDFEADRLAFVVRDGRIVQYKYALWCD
ncbi:hypothetical protein Q5H93_06450 [Hymenobacter sp. ASUV-10]|uniref:Lipoprotein n=1 Tax=Hymenobacter aranciens TaxID=3063996 RepID=A0ABT9B7W5_9BACT|nr:hypothetical protein [Hymenobacter sp. ASUV-10]MDO7874366.1 hypothetical protein [Hymenobacter sp. ASUV-10]